MLFVYCCDVLEHIRDWDRVIGEVARVLKHYGVFLYDTINRATTSKMVFIKMGQEWRFTRYLPPIFTSGRCSSRRKN